jgi:hypothetical protein
MLAQASAVALQSDWALAMAATPIKRAAANSFRVVMVVF